MPTPSALRPADRLRYLELIWGIFLAGPKVRIVSLFSFGTTPAAVGTVSGPLAAELAAVSGQRVARMRFVSGSAQTVVVEHAADEPGHPWLWSPGGPAPGNLRLLGYPQDYALESARPPVGSSPDQRRAFAYGIVECPPIDYDPGAAAAAVSSDGVLLIVRPGHTKRAEIQRARRTFDMIGARLLGCVFSR